MFDDKRSKKIIFVAHCVLNQNSKLDKCAHYPGAIKEVVELFLKEDIGMVQMSCPELLFLGLNRQSPADRQLSVQDEDTRIGKLMSEDNALEICKFLAVAHAYQMEEYVNSEFEVLGIIGINGSPTCGVETNWRDGQEAGGKGAYINELSKLLEQHELDIPIRGIKAYNPEEAVSICEKLIRDSKK